MSFGKKKTLKFGALIIAALSFISLGFELMCVYLFENEILTLILPFISLTAESLSLCILFLVMLVCFLEESPRFMISRGLMLSFIPFIFSLPTAVLRAMEIKEYAFDIFFFSIASALIDFILFIFKAALIFLVLILLLKIIFKKREPREVISESFALASPFRLDSAGALALFIAPTSLFAINFISEFIDTVSFFSKNFDTFRGGELAYIVVYYVFLLALLILSLYLSFKFKNAFLEEKDISQK